MDQNKLLVVIILLIPIAIINLITVYAILKNKRWYFYPEEVSNEGFNLKQTLLQVLFRKNQKIRLKIGEKNLAKIGLFKVLITTVLIAAILVWKL